jgi:hypothetical protein
MRRGGRRNLKLWMTLAGKSALSKSTETRIILEGVFEAIGGLLARRKETVILASSAAISAMPGGTYTVDGHA